MAQTGRRTSTKPASSTGNGSATAAKKGSKTSAKGRSSTGPDQGQGREGLKWLLRPQYLPFLFIGGWYLYSTLSGVRTVDWEPLKAVYRNTRGPASSANGGHDRPGATKPDARLPKDVESVLRSHRPFPFDENVAIVEDGISDKREAVRTAFKESWNAYERDAFGYDNYHPIGKSGSNLEGTGIGYFIIDGLDSLLLMDLPDEYARAREWIQTKLSFDVGDKHHAFETTIRVLGGLLAAYHLSNEDKLYLNKAVDIADRLLPIFDTPSGIPLSFINLREGVAIADSDNYNMSSVAEAATLQLEFKYLSHLTGNPVYWEKVEGIMHTINNAEKTDGLVQMFMDPKTGDFRLSDIRLGSRADSYYEYLLKQYLQTGQTEQMYRDMYDTAMRGIRTHLGAVSPIDDSVYTTELKPGMHPQTRQLGWQRLAKQDHLVCFLGGLMMMGATNGVRMTDEIYKEYLSEEDKRNWAFGEELTKTCVKTYTQSRTGLGAEIVFYFRDKAMKAQGGDKSDRAWYVDKRRRPTEQDPNPAPPIDARFILRPETVESLFLGWRLTHDPVYRKWGWDIFRAIEKHCKVETGGYASIRDVDELPAQFEDKMETFFLSETLKYLFLLFSDDDVIPLTKYVFNTEAHILPIFMPDI